MNAVLLPAEQLRSSLDELAPSTTLKEQDLTLPGPGLDAKGALLGFFSQIHYTRAL